MTTIVEIYRTDGRHSESGWTEADCVVCPYWHCGPNSEPVTEHAVAEHLEALHPRRYRQAGYFWDVVADYT